jgi:signal recognition particle receptor subunit beta
MAFAASDRGPGPAPRPLRRAPVATKVVVAGGLGAGKTTLVAAVSETGPLATEALMIERAGDAAGQCGVATTVSMDIGRITLDDDLVLCLVAAPGRHRFWFLWDDLVRGAIGAVVLVDARRPAECLPALDYFDGCDMPYVVAVNRFEGTREPAPEDMRTVLALPPHIPVVTTDARSRTPVLGTLRALVGHALDAAPG